MKTARQLDVDLFAEQGYLVVEDVFDQDLEIVPVIEEYKELFESLVTGWHAEGLVDSTYSDLDFPQRWARVLTEVGAAGFLPLDISLPTKGVTAQTPMHTGPAVFALLSSPHILDLVEQIVGSEVLSNPIQHVRIKPPEHLLPDQLGASLLTSSAWHQDQGVALPEVDDTNMLTVWVAVTDATVKNGCLCVVPGSHKGGLRTHCPGGAERPLSIPDQLVAEAGVATPLPVRSGGVVLMHRQTIHGSLVNNSDGIRWSFDLRYQPTGQPTGRPQYPAFVARSRQHPESEISDWRVWSELWKRAQNSVAVEPSVFAAPSNRWDGSAAVCA